MSNCQAIFLGKFPSRVYWIFGLLASMSKYLPFPVRLSSFIFPSCLHYLCILLSAAAAALLAFNSFPCVLRVFTTLKSFLCKVLGTYKRANMPKNMLHKNRSSAKF